MPNLPKIHQNCQNCQKWGQKNPNFAFCQMGQMCLRDHPKNCPKSANFAKFVLPKSNWPKNAENAQILARAPPLIQQSRDRSAAAHTDSVNSNSFIKVSSLCRTFLNLCFGGAGGMSGLSALVPAQESSRLELRKGPKR